MKKRIIIVIVLLSLGVALHRFWPMFQKAPHFSGTIEVTEHSVGARAAGRLTQLFVKEGDLVKKGQLLGTLDRYDQASKDFERVLALFKQGGTTLQSVEWADLAVSDQKLVAPVDGVILVKIRETGEIVASGGAVITVGDRSDMWIRIYVPEGQVSRVRLQQKATIRVDGIKDIFTGHVSSIPPRAEFTPRNVQSSDERVTQTFAVKVTLDSPPDYLRPGVSGDVVLQ